MHRLVGNRYASCPPYRLIRAVGHVAKARGMAQIARDSGLGRASLYKSFAPGAKPRFDTVVKVMHALGVELHAQPVQG